MSQTLYNEGRVVGYSAYETYVKQTLAEDPNATPATEKEWLASSISMGSSMIVKIATDTTEGMHYVDIQLPTNTRLCAANTIFASYFDGDAHFPSGSVWADRVTDYGTLISNTSTTKPTGDLGPTGTVPTGTIAAITDAVKNQLKSYIKVVDGIIIQPGTWSQGTNRPPEQDFTPNLTSYPRLRLLIDGPIATAFCMILTGFTVRSVINGVSGIDSATNTSNPMDGDFLGPAVFPWAGKVIFSVPPIYIDYLKSAITVETDRSGSNTTARVTTITTMEDAVGKAVSLIDEDGTDLPVTGTSGTISTDDIIWQQLLAALANNSKIDVLGTNMKAVKTNLPKNCIQFPNGLRLYIAGTAPTGTDIPIGSIGIGW